MTAYLRRRFHIVARALAWEAHAIWRSIRLAATEPGAERDTAVQSLKAAGAALLSWAVAGWWWDAPMALMAPWTALFLMQNSVYRSLLSALQQFTVVVLGTLLAAAAGVLTHHTMAAMALALPLTVLLGSYARFGTQGFAAPTAALFVLAYGSYTSADIAHRFLETLLGAAIGISMNALVLPPVHARRLLHLHRQLSLSSAELLHTVADGLADGYTEKEAQGWFDSARRLSDVTAGLREARRWSDESNRVNPGLRLRRRVEPAPPPTEWDLVWAGVTEHLSSVIRMLSDPAEGLSLGPDQTKALGTLLRAAGDACRLGTSSTQPTSRRPRDGHAHRDFRRSLARASAAHRRLTAACAWRRRASALAAGGLLTDTRRLLTALLTAMDTDALAPRSATPLSEQYAGG
ncbi:FUSC family protein [Streptomyces sp. NPDC006333]|uniref:FUSC family protein n=1 Tax=Streptomyces sp. NPDC006333 TaxID=3156753 RepID=UPI0033B830A7